MEASSPVDPAFGRPGGESRHQGRARPIDLVHLARQTMGDRDLEAEVLAMFVQQARQLRGRIAAAGAADRSQLAHALRGAASGVGAFEVAAAARAVEVSPGRAAGLRTLAAAIDEVCDFIAAISR